MARPRLDTPNFRLIRRGSRYYVRWWADGRWQRVSTGTEDRSAAQRFLAQFAAGAASPPPPAIPTIGAILDGYLADRKPDVAAYATLEYACAALRRHLGELQPHHLSRDKARRYATQRRREGYQVGPANARRTKPVSPGTITREIVTLRAALRWAVAEQWIASAPEIPAPPAPRPRDRWLTRAEAAALLAACKQPHLRTFIALALYTAARRGAILELTWPQVNLDRRLITPGAGSGNKRRAPVPIGDALLPYLREARRAATGDRVIEYGGEPVGNIKTGFAATCARAGLTGVTPHTLRHTAATWMAMAGVPLAKIARFLGNSEAMVEQVYGHHHPDYLRDAAAALSGATGPENHRAAC